MLHYARGSKLPLGIAWVEILQTSAQKVEEDYNEAVTLDDRIDLICTATTLDDNLGNLYKLLLSEALLLPPPTISYLKELIASLNNQDSMDDIFLTDRIGLLTNTVATDAAKPNWSDLERQVLDQLQHLPAIKVIKYFVKGPGLSKYFELLRLRTLGD